MNLFDKISTIKGEVARDGVSHIEGMSFIVLNCEETPLDESLFPSFYFNKILDLKFKQKVEVDYSKFKEVTVEGITYRKAYDVRVLESI